MFSPQIAKVSMLTLHLSSFVKFLIGILFLQSATGLMVYTALKTDLTQTWPLFAALGIAVAAMTAFWFNAIADGTRKESLAKAQASFSREREQIRVRAEQEKIREIKNNQRQAERIQQRVRLGSQIKTGVLLAGGVGAGVLLLMTQMISLGMLALSTAGGAAIGYGVRARQERLGRGEGWLRLGWGSKEKPVPVLTSQVVADQVPALKPPLKSRKRTITQPRPETERNWETD